MIGKPGPFQVIEDEGSGCVDTPIIPPRRRYSCPHYQACLDVAAALNWDNFTCRGCSGELNEPLVWRAAREQKNDSLAASICRVSPPSVIYGGISALPGAQSGSSTGGGGAIVSDENEDVELLEASNPRSPS